MILTDEQQAIYDDIVHNVHHHKGRYESVIIGYAGTGKSTLTSKIIEDISEFYSIAVTSPTHKANAVLSAMIEQTAAEPTNITISTIHSFLGLKLVYEKNRQVLKHDPSSKLSNSRVDVLIVDECSMISDSMFKHILEQAFRVRRAIIFVGDMCQLPPVENENLVDNKLLSPTFNLENVYYLDKVLRQALDNPIINIATTIRECIGTGVDPLSIINRIHNLETITRMYDTTEFVNIYRDYVKTESRIRLFENVSNNKIISYTNNNVNNYNNMIRNDLFYGAEHEFQEGEPIVFESVTQQCPYTVQQMIQCPEFRKESFLGIECWQFKLSQMKYILVVGPETVGKYNDYMNDLADKITIGEHNTLTGKKYTWQDYYIIKEKINIVNYPYAITVHKSQGSTFDHLWFDTAFLDKIQDNDTRCRIIYTAMTRPKHSVILK